jgi:hypothetical protein
MYLMRYLAFLTTILVFSPGCGGPAIPPTYAVTGKVVYKDGTPLAGGMIEFQPAGQPSLKTTASVEKDGTFTLSTLVEGQTRTAGAVEGEHRVVVVPSRGEDQKFPAIRVLTSKYTVKPEPNEVTIRIEKTGP